MHFGALPLEGLLDRVASAEPTPGGGTASAVAGALGCALCEMVLGLTLGRPKFAAEEGRLAPLLPDARELRAEFLRLADEDSRAYAAFVEAARLPKGTPAEQGARSAAMRRAARRAAEVPLRTAECAVEALRIAAALGQHANPSARTDALVGALLAGSAFQGARRNVLANLDGMGDPALAQQMRGQLDTMGKLAEALLADARGAGEP
jgi:formiminotetrahydrofolate cyclodeaminase